MGKCGTFIQCNTQKWEEGKHRYSVQHGSTLRTLHWVKKMSQIKPQCDSMYIKCPEKQIYRDRKEITV